MIRIPCSGASAAAAFRDVLRRDDGVLLVPTETVYGLVCDASHEASRAKIYEMKRRPASKLLTLFFGSREAVEAAFPAMPETAKRFAAAFCPGPVTLIVPDGDAFTGFRIPDHPALLNLLKAYGRPLASTSANLSGQPPAHTVDEALASLAIPPDGVLDGGAIPPDSVASTVIKVERGGAWSILRPGPVTEDMLQAALK
ncbi:MAG: L-threonylcarbamoyladenylate synthase [Lentisphaeria bacterium]|nr:L-threonylcarbamoyladenylate synthase [Lentisphaeria bacterium]